MTSRLAGWLAACGLGGGYSSDTASLVPKALWKAAVAACTLGTAIPGCYREAGSLRSLSRAAAPRTPHLAVAAVVAGLSITVASSLVAKPPATTDP